MNLSRVSFLLVSIVLVLFFAGCNKASKSSKNHSLTIVPMEKAVLAGQTVSFELREKNTDGLNFKWDL